MDMNKSDTCRKLDSWKNRKYKAIRILQTKTEYSWESHYDWQCGWSDEKNKNDFTKCCKDKVYRNQINIFCFLNHECRDQAIEDFFQIIEKYEKIVQPNTVLRSK